MTPLELASKWVIFDEAFFEHPLLMHLNPRRTVPPRKWAVVDANEIATGVMVSLTLDLDHPVPFGQLTRDQEANGLVHFASGISTLLNVVIAKDYANAISLLPDPEFGKLELGREWRCSALWASCLTNVFFRGNHTGN